MRVRIAYGRAVMLVVDIDADGAIQFWRSENARTGAHVELSTVDKWLALPFMHKAIAGMARGAA